MNDKYIWYISINIIGIEKSFMTHSNITPFVEQVYCWIIYSDILQFKENACF